MMTTLRKALEEGKLDEFIAEREGKFDTDEEAFQAVLNSMAGKSKSEPETSKPDCSDD